MFSVSSSNPTVTPLTFGRVAKAVLFSGATGFVFIAAQFVGFMIAGAMLALSGGTPSEDLSSYFGQPLPQVFVLLVIALVSIGILAFICKIAGWQPFWRTVRLQPIRFHPLAKYSALSYVMYFACLLLVVQVVGVLLPSIDVGQPQRLGVDPPTYAVEYIALFIALVVIPSVVEEIYFRGFLYTRLKLFLERPWLASVFVAVLFGIAHLEFFADGPLNWIASIDTMLLSFFLVWVLEKTGSLWASITLHMLKNSLAFVVLFVV